MLKDSDILQKGSFMQLSFGSKPRIAKGTRPTPVEDGRAISQGSERFASVLGSNYQDQNELERLCVDLVAQLGGKSPDVAIVFAAAPENPSFRDIVPTLQNHLGPRVLIGCSGSGVIGAGKELEYGQGISILGVRCDSLSVYPFSFNNEDACGKDATPESLSTSIGADPSEFENGLMLVLIDPLTVSTEYALSMLDSVFPTVMKFGALVSGSHEFRGNRMMLGDELLDQGAVGLLIKQDFAAETIVSGSEEPIGPELVITRCNRNEIQSIDNRSPVAALEEIFANADPVSQIRMKRNLVVGLESGGILVDPDYVMRNIMDMDEETGAMTIGDIVEEGQKLKFHVRDSDLASQRLTQNLENFVDDLRVQRKGVDAMLCFNSVARGSRMFEQENHDAEIIGEHLGNVPVVGFFSNGEIASKKGGFSLTDDDEYSSRVMGYSDTLVMLRDVQQCPRSPNFGHVAESSSRI